MIERPERYIEDFIKAGADGITIHAEATDRIGECIDMIHARGKKAALAINPETPVETIYDYLSDIDMALVMSVHPGYGGQSYIADVNSKITDLRMKMGNDFHIEVDGGINIKNIKEVNKLGADVIVAGSAVFTGDIEDSVSALLKECR